MTMYRLGLAIGLACSIAVVGCSDDTGGAAGDGGAGGSQMVFNVTLESETFAAEGDPDSCTTSLYASIAPVAGAVRYSAFTFGHDQTSEQWLAGTRPMSATWTPDMGPTSTDAFFPNGMRNGNFAFVETSIFTACANTATLDEARIRQM
ncbi:MAG: hypothetical protein WCB63_20645, partial [Polyangiales bacterium]